MRAPDVREETTMGYKGGVHNPESMAGLKSQVHHVDEIV